MEDVQVGSFLIGDGKVVNVSVSVGLAHSPTDADNLRNLYAAADAALYEAKRSGRNRVTAASDPLAVIPSDLSEAAPDTMRSPSGS